MKYPVYFIQINNCLCVKPGGFLRFLGESCLSRGFFAEQRKQENLPSPVSREAFSGRQILQKTKDNMNEVQTL